LLGAALSTSTRGEIALGQLDAETIATRFRQERGRLLSMAEFNVLSPAIEQAVARVSAIHDHARVIDDQVDEIMEMAFGLTDEHRRFLDDYWLERNRRGNRLWSVTPPANVTNA
jgi:hypothetical protein